MIFLIVFAMLIAAGAVSYTTTRSILLSDLDDSLAAKAIALTEVVPPAGQEAAWHAELDDRYVIHTNIGQAMASARAGLSSRYRPVVLHRGFFDLGDGTRGRSVTVRAMGRAAGSTKLLPITITYSGSCARFDMVLRKLGLVLAVCVVMGSLTAAWLAGWAARIALHPLRTTADAIGAIHEHQLDRRIEVRQMPQELMPVAVCLNGLLERLERYYVQRETIPCRCFA